MYSAPPAVAPQKPWYQRSWAIAVAAVLLVGFIGSMVSNRDDDVETQATASESSASRQSSQSQVAPESSLAPPPVVAPPPPAAPPPTAAPPPAPAPTTWTMPNLVGANLQDAQDTIQVLTGNALFFTTSTDLTGQSRFQVLDANWQVCSQNVPAGSVFDASAAIDFGVVKNEESCP